MSDDVQAALDVRGLSVRYGEHNPPVVTDFSMTVPKGSSVALVGESGSGKSTILRAVIGLLPDNASILKGEVSFFGRDLLALSDREFAGLRGSDIGFIYQDPNRSFNHNRRLGPQVARVLRYVRPELPKEDRAAEVVRMLERVGLDGESAAGKYPFQLSGGELQRVLIATACLAGRPRFLVADEPTTSLDVTIEAEIIELIREIRREMNLTLLLVTHDLGVVNELCEHAVILNRGVRVESGPVSKVLGDPQQDYTKALISSIPKLPSRRDLLEAKGRGR